MHSLLAWNSEIQYNMASRKRRMEEPVAAQEEDEETQQTFDEAGGETEGEDDGEDGEEDGEDDGEEDGEENGEENYDDDDVFLPPWLGIEDDNLSPQHAALIGDLYKRLVRADPASAQEALAAHKERLGEEAEALNLGLPGKWTLTSEDDEKVAGRLEIVKLTAGIEMMAFELTAHGEPYSHDVDKFGPPEPVHEDLGVEVLTFLTRDSGEVKGTLEIEAESEDRIIGTFDIPAEQIYVNIVGTRA